MRNPRLGGWLPGLAAIFLSLWFAADIACAQHAGKGRKPVAEQDPYTEADAGALTKAGYLTLEPAHFVGSQSTKAVGEALGGVPVLFAETEHFRIASSLDEYDLRSGDMDRKKLKPALERLKLRLPKVNDRTRVLDPWLRMHLYAALLEETYERFIASFGLDPKSNAQPPSYLGMRDKFSVLLTDKRSELGRYSKSYCQMQSDELLYHHFEQEDSMFMGISFEGIESDESRMRFLVTYGLVSNMVLGYGGRSYYGGVFWHAGVARWFARQGNEDLIVFFDPPGDLVQRREKDTQWERKVRARVEQKSYPSAEELLGFRNELDLKFNDHMMLWSRIDFLMSQDVSKRRSMLESMSKPLPWLADAAAYLPQFQQRFKEALKTAYDLDLAAYDQAWASFVLANYPKR